MHKTKKQKLALIMILILIAALINTPLAKIEVKSLTYGDYEYTILDDDTIELTRYTGKGGNIAFPKKIEGKNVTVINNYIFSDAENLVYGVTIPNGIKKIGFSTFRNCINLTSITIPASVKEFYYYGTTDGNPLGNCTSLEEIKVDENNTVYDSRQNCNAIIRTSDDALIAGCKNTVIPDDVTIIAKKALSCCKFSHFTIPDNVISIEFQAFASCLNLLDITIPASVKNISSQCFSSCTHLEEIKVDENNTVYDSRQNCNAIIRTSDNVLISGCMNTIIPSDVTGIDDYAFEGCINLSAITIPKNVTSIGSYAFTWCNNLTDIIISDGVTSLGNSAFEGCLKLTTIKIPNSITKINSNTFGKCDNLTALYIPDSVTAIEDDVFYHGYSDYGEPSPDLIIYTTPDSYAEQWAENNGYAIEYYDFSKEEEPTTEQPTTEEPTTERPTTEEPTTEHPTTEKSTTQIPITIQVTTASAITTRQLNTLPAEPEIDKIYTVKGMRYKVTSSKNVSFLGGKKKNITKLTIPDEVVILEKTFQVTAIDKKACKKYKKLTKVIIGKNVKTIGNEAFYGCTKLTNITLGKGVKIIGNKVFYGDKKLIHITIKGADIQKIGKKTLYKTPKKVKITAPRKAILKYKRLLNAAK